MQSNETLEQNQTLASVEGKEKLEQILNGCKFKLTNCPFGFHYKSEDHGLGVFISKYNNGGFILYDIGWIEESESSEHCLTVSLSGIFKSQLDRIPMSLIQILND